MSAPSGDGREAYPEGCICPAQSLDCTAHNAPEPEAAAPTVGDVSRGQYRVAKTAKPKMSEAAAPQDEVERLREADRQWREKWATTAARLAAAEGALADLYALLDDYDARRGVTFRAGLSHIRGKVDALRAALGPEATT